jgi:hypothetical protein
VTLNVWERDGGRLRETSRSRGGYASDMDYDPRTGRVYFGDGGTTGSASMCQVDGDSL